jgi:hypothetical protein
MTLGRKIREKIAPPISTWDLVNLGAKQSQDENPQLDAEARPDCLSYTWALEPSRMHHSRCAPRRCTTRPLLSRVNLPPSIPARPFGLGWRFDRSPAGNADHLVVNFAPAVDPHTKQRRVSMPRGEGQSL